MCCAEGVYADVGERGRILAHAGLIRRHMDATQSTDERQWFENEEFVDSDFPTGRCVGTNVIRGKCAFLDGTGHCSLQVASNAGGLGRWALKPIYCILYPLDVSDRVVSYDPVLQDEQSCCTTSERFDVPVFEACGEELIHLVGDDGYRELQAHYVEHFSPTKVNS
jgi:hypothetical protein